MTHKTKGDDIKRRKNDTNFTDEVRKAFGKLPYIRLKDLINRLESEHRNMIGYSRITIGRKIKDLCEEKTLVRVYSDGFGKYGIREKSNNAVYLLFKETTEIKEHLDNVFELLKSGSPVDIQMVLEELSNYRNRYVLDGVQLDRLIEKLETKNDRLRHSLFMLIIEQINKGIEPTDMPQFNEILEKLLDEYQLDSYRQHEIRPIVIELLGYCSNQIVVNQLLKDAEALNKSKDNAIFTYLSNSYSGEILAKMIDENRKKLFAAQKKFVKDGKENSAGLISTVRSNAIRNLDSMEYRKQKAQVKMNWSSPQMK